MYEKDFYSFQVNLNDEEFPGFGSSLVITTCGNTNQELKCKECDYESTEMRKPKETYVKKPSLTEFSINSIETYKCNECEYEIKEIRKLKNQSKRNHI